ncbi:PTS sugar transporter subunit IIB [uncultured Anaerococcus sp.]|uniref:PTS sugar transporter subunit IIB n=1 Tax=uncultured Anaerococcus sp. TaxID=293428 RepID=UPI002626DCF6|nr:PTS sugar transporter subunit IIB [uncultured Anaerococcus sp.]
MVGIILASHGHFAEGIQESAQMIFGEQENFETAILLPSMGPDDLKSDLEAAIDKIDSDQILFLVDLWGGTPFNQASNILEGHEDNWAIVAGMNLPMVIEALSERFTSESSHDIAKAIIGSAKEGVKIKPEDLNEVSEPATSAKSDEDARDAEVEKAISNGSIPEGTVIGDGKIDIVLARIDTRLLHGQVATSWTKATNPDRIIVVSDTVSQDELRKNMVMQAEPPGVKAHVVPVRKMKEILEDPRFGATRALLLFEKPQDVKELLDLGGQLDQVNIGSMAYSEGKVNLTNAIAMDKDDVKTIEELKDSGIEFNVRKVPADKPENLDNMLKKAKKELNI